MKPVKCCGENPVIWTGCDKVVLGSLGECCRECIEKIFCTVCDRTIYGCDEESVQDWNDGGYE